MSTITTFSGEVFNPLSPDTQKIKIEDIAHSLSLLCRANGHFVQFFSVAQHAIHCAQEAAARGFNPKVQLACLLHDASESYLSDLTRPIKKHLPLYLEAEAQLQNTIYHKYLPAPLTLEEQAQVQQIDDDMLEGEFAVLLKKRTNGRAVTLQTSPSYGFEAFDVVENKFLTLFSALLNAQAQE